MTSFAAPFWFALALVAAARLYLFVRDRREAEGAFEISSLSVVSSRTSPALLLAWLPPALEFAGWLLLIVALARPQQITTVATDDRYGIDIVVALDSSGSMAAEDFRPRNRFAVAKEVIGQFIDRRDNDRIGIVTFGVRAATRVPITFDREVAKSILASAKVGENGDGTAIGQAIATAVNRLRTSKSRSRVIILVTDGVSNAGSIEPATAATLAARLGVKVYTIGVGSEGDVPIPVKAQNPFTGQIETTYQMIRADLDEAMLKQIATVTGGEYFRATDPNSMSAVLRKIDQLEKSRLAAPKKRTVKELYPTPLAAGLGALLLALLMTETRWMRLAR